MAGDPVKVRLPISLVIIAKNEARNLERCIQSAPLVSEVVVVENESTDDTADVARRLGAQVFHEPWRGFGLQKKFAAEKATNDWILALDADEALSPELAAELAANFATLDPQAVYEFPRRSYHLGRWIDHGGWYPDYQPRLFHRKHAMWNAERVHEGIPSVRRERMKKDLHHYVFRDISHQVETNNRYSSLQAEAYVAGGGKFSILKAFVKPWVKFVECYFLKLGILDGYPGFVIAVGAGYSVFIRWVKIWEMEKSRARR